MSELINFFIKLKANKKVEIVAIVLTFLFAFDFAYEFNVNKSLWHAFVELGLGCFYIFLFVAKTKRIEELLLIFMLYALQIGFICTILTEDILKLSIVEVYKKFINTDIMFLIDNIQNLIFIILLSILIYHRSNLKD